MDRLNNDPNGKSINSIDNACTIVSLIRDRDGVTAGDLVDAVDLSRRSVYLYLRTLADHGVIRREDGRYRLDIGLLELGGRAAATHPLTQEVHGRLSSLAVETEETAEALVEIDGEGMVLRQVRANNAIQTFVPQGTRRPLHTNAAGQVILAFLPADRRAELIEEGDLERETPETITDRDALRTRLAEIRDRGVAVAVDEADAEIAGVAAPIRKSERVLGAIGVRGFTASVCPDGTRPTAGIVDAVRETATNVEGAIGSVGGRT